MAVKSKTIKQRKNPPTVVLQAISPVPIDRLISTVTSSSIERFENGKVALFMCHVSAGCPLPELRLYKGPTRMDFDSKQGTIQIWNLVYNPRKPDVVIENAVVSAIS